MCYTARMPTAPLRLIHDQKRLAALCEVTRILHTSLDINQALAHALSAAIRLTNAERGFLMLADDVGELRFALARDANGQPVDESHFEISRSLVRQVADTGQAVVTTNAQQDPRFAHKESVVSFALRSVMAVPLTVREGDSLKVIGVLYVDNKLRVALFSQSDLNLLSSFALQAAIAIQNARRHTAVDSNLAARMADLQAMQAISRRLNTTLDMEQVLEHTLEGAWQRCQAETGWIARLEPDRARVSATYPAALLNPALGQELPQDDPALEDVLATGQAQRSWADGQARLAAPIIRDKRMLAVVVLQRPETPFTEAHAEFLTRLCDQAAIALENARLYASLKQAQEARNAFVSAVSHELRIPMTAIKGYVDLMLQGFLGGLTDQQKHYLNVVRANVERMAVLVANLSDISRLDTGRVKLELASVDVNDAVQTAINELHASLESKQQTVVQDYPPHLRAIRTDPARLGQVLGNLLTNAHKYSPAGSTITVRVTTAEDKLHISVIDTGYGISPADQARLFTQFFRSDDQAIRQESGWGLGLHIAKRLTELMGGRISVHSQLGRGSEFTLTLPYPAGGNLQ